MELLDVSQPCCAPLVDETISADAAAVLATRLKAIAEPTRLRLLSMIAAGPGGEMCVCDLTEPVGLSQPTVSHHLKVLREAGIVDSERQGLWAYYYVKPEALKELGSWLS